MAAFQPIDDAGPRLAFGIIRFLRVFFAAASPGVVAENPQDKDRPWTLPAVQAKFGAGWNDGFKGPLRKKNGFQEIFLIGWI